MAATSKAITVAGDSLIKFGSGLLFGLFIQPYNGIDFYPLSLLTLAFLQCLFNAYK